MTLDPLTYARLAEESYLAKPDIGIADSAARAIVRSTADGKAVICPGTNNIACWLADLDATPTETRLGGIHAGFNLGALAIYDAVEQIAPGALAGHSEGADLVLGLAGYLCVAGKPPKFVYAFEPARMCIDDTLAGILKNCGVQVFACRNGQDVVPLVPRVLFPWRMPAELVAIGQASEPFPNVADHAMARVTAALQFPVQAGDA